MLQAMQRDLGLTAQEAQQRLSRSLWRARWTRPCAPSCRTTSRLVLRRRHRTLVVGVTEASALDDAGRRRQAKLVDASIETQHGGGPARPQGKQRPRIGHRLVRRRQEQLGGRHHRARHAAQAEKFVAASGVDGDNVEIVESTEQPRTFMDVIGGQRLLHG